MNKLRKLKWAMPLAMVFVLALSACGGGAGADEMSGMNTDGSAKRADAAANNAPFTMTIMVSGAGIDTGQQDARYKLPSFLAKYPNVSFEYQLIANLNEVVASGQFPDLANVVPAKLFDLKAAGLTFDLSGLLKKNNLDLSAFPAPLLRSITDIGGTDGMIALPGQPPDFKYWAAYALAYNKDIFDKFGIAYPKDNMTWEEVIELSKRLNRSDGGTEYHGLTLINPWNTLQAQRGLSFLNKAGKVDLANPGWSAILNIMKEVDEAQNHWKQAVAGAPNAFPKDKNTAMLAGVVGAYIQGAEDLEKNGFNWDMATFPRFADQPVTLPGGVGVLVPTSKSKHPDAVIDLIKTMYATGGSNSIYENPAALKKNLNAIRGHEIAIPVPSAFDTQLQSTFSKQVNEMIANSQDVNTTLRNMQEAFQKVVDSAK